MTEQPELPEAFYLPLGDNTFEATYATESPWDTAAQHGGPPTALLGHVLRTFDPVPGMRIARVTVEFLGAVPRTTVQATARVVRPGRRIRLTEAALTAGDTTVATASAWEIATDGTAPDLSAEPTRLPGPQPQQFFTGFTRWGYGEAIEWRWIHGSLDELGPAAVWTRARLPLVAGEQLYPLDRVLLTADSANGISGVLPQDKWLFIPPTATVTLHRHPAAEWVSVDAATTVADGVGSTLGKLADQYGELGTISQPLLVARR